MTETDEPQYRTYHQPDPDDVEIRDPEGEDDTFALRLPIVTTGEVRNEGDDAFEREALEGMAEQINDGQVPVFPNHGASPDMAPRYGASRKLGVWRDAEVESRDDGEDQVTATAVLMEPETLPPETGALRGVLASIKAQAERGVPISTSIGWSEDEAAPGGNDLWETSIVGIPADPRTTSDDVAVAAARDALENADLDTEEREQLVDDFRAVVMGSDAEGGNARDSVTDEDTDSPDTGSGDDNRDESDGMDAQEYREFMREQQEQQTEILRTLAESLREEDEDEDEDGDGEEDDEGGDENEGDGEDEEDDEDEDGDGQSADGDPDADGQSGDTPDELQGALETLREGGVDVDDLDVPGPDGAQDADGVDGAARDGTDTDNEPSFSFAPEGDR